MSAERYTNLLVLASNPIAHAATANIRLLARSRSSKARKLRKATLDALSNFVGSPPSQRGPDRRTLASISRTPIDPDYLPNLNGLYSTLRDYSICQNSENACRINTILRLKNWKTVTENNNLQFELLFLGHPHQNGNLESGCQWRETSISTAISKYVILCLPKMSRC